jgi:hypothetical protein
VQHPVDRHYLLSLATALIICAQPALAAEAKLSKLEQSKQPGGAHAFLASLEGEWEGMARTWFDAGQEAESDISPVKGSFRSILGGRFAMHEYTGTLMGEPLEGVAIHGYDLGEDRFVTAWVDSAHNGSAIMLSEGERGAWPGTSSVLGSYADYSTAGHPRWGWRTEITLPEPDRLLVTHYNISPDGEEYTGVEFDYRRVASE